jgi:hypothetical protein
MSDTMGQIVTTGVVVIFTGHDYFALVDFASGASFSVLLR